jgi:hypothetical protein
MKMSTVFLLLSFVGLVTVGLVGCKDTDENPTPGGPSPAASTGKTTAGQFSESVPPAIVKLQNSVVAGGKCNMESINGVPWATEPPYAAHQKDNVSILGWGVDDQAKRLPDSVFLRFQQGQRVFYAPIETLRLPRAELVDYFKENYYKDSGYRADASLANLSPGDYQAMIVMTFPDKAILCAAGRTVKIN